MRFFQTIIATSKNHNSGGATPPPVESGDFVIEQISIQDNQQFIIGDSVTFEFNVREYTGVPDPVITDISSTGFDYDQEVFEGIKGLNIYVDGVKHNRTLRGLFKNGYDISDVVLPGESFDVQFSYVFDDNSESNLSLAETITLSSSTGFNYNKDVVLVFDGDSRTQGTIGDATVSQYYPKQVQNYFTGKFNSLTFYSYGVNGHSIADLNNDYLQDIDDKPEIGKTNILVSFEDVNSFAILDITNDQHWRSTNYYFEKAKASGYDKTIIVVGWLPRDGVLDQSVVDRMLEFSKRVMETPISEAPWDYAIDLKEAENIGGGEGQNSNEYFFDHIHLNMIGYDIVAQKVIDKINDITRE